MVTGWLHTGKEQEAAQHKTSNHSRNKLGCGFKMKYRLLELKGTENPASTRICM